MRYSTVPWNPGFMLYFSVLRPLLSKLDLGLRLLPFITKKKNAPN